MNGDFVDRLVAHTRTEVKELGGRHYTIGAGGASLIKEPLPTPLDARSLTAVVDFGVEPGGFIHVASAASVAIYGSLLGDRQRPCSLVAVFTSPLGNNFFGAYHEAEPFVIALQSTFRPTPDLATVLKVAGTLESEAVVNLDDDGVSQKATVRSGITRKAEMMIHNPVELAPFRTFAEAVQPVSPFILRLKGGGDGELPRCALIVADGNAWQLEAMASIKAWLAERMPGVSIIA